MKVLKEGGVDEENFEISVNMWHLGTTYYIRAKRKKKS